MAGLNFSTTTIINKIDPKAEAVASKGIIRLGRGVDLVAKYITAVYKTAGHGPTMCQATIDLTGLEVGDYRLDVTLGTDGASPLIFAKPDVQNGIPFWVGIHVDSTVDEAFVKELVHTINKNKLFTIGDNLLTVEATGTTLTLTGNSEFLRFRKVELMKFEAANEDSQEKTTKVDGKVTINEKGRNGFGTYSHIIKDLRLPTGANLAFNHLRQDETPNISATDTASAYTQYVIEYEAPSSIRGTQVVGSVNHSYTQHVAWVAAGVDFDTLLSDANVTKVDTVAVNLTNKKEGSDLLDPTKNETSELDD